MGSQQKLNKHIKSYLRYLNHLKFPFQYLQAGKFFLDEIDISKIELEELYTYIYRKEGADRTGYKYRVSQKILISASGSF